MLPYRLNILGGVLLTATSVAHAQAPEPQPTADVAAVTHGLAPAQIAVIRAIGRNVLAAKKSAVENPADAEQLTRLRAAVESLIAVELDPENRAPITIQGTESASPSPVQTAAAIRRDTARTDVRALAGQMRQRGELLASHAQSGGETETKSAGLPVGSQRAQLFERMAQKLDAALAANDLERIAQLHALRDQLQAGRGRLVDAPLTHATPTLQATPSTSPTVIRPVSVSEAKPHSTPDKARPRKPKAK